MMLSIVVVLPAPLRPTRQTTSLAPTLSDTPRRMCAGPRYVSIALTSSTSLVLRFRISHHFAASSERNSKSKEH